MNKGLTITGAVFLVLSLLGVVVGGAMASNSVASLEDMDELEDPWNYENATNGTITYDDADGMGELGFYFYIDTPMKDDDGDGERERERRRNRRGDDRSNDGEVARDGAERG